MFSLINDEMFNISAGESSGRKMEVFFNFYMSRLLCLLMKKDPLRTAYRLTPTSDNANQNGRVTLMPHSARYINPWDN